MPLFIIAVNDSWHTCLQKVEHNAVRFPFILFFQNKNSKHWIYKPRRKLNTKLMVRLIPIVEPTFCQLTFQCMSFATVEYIIRLSLDKFNWKSPPQHVVYIVNYQLTQLGNWFKRLWFSIQMFIQFVSSLQSIIAFRLRKASFDCWAGN